MATDLATRGWQRAACPSSGGTAGYALDANDLVLLTRGSSYGNNIYLNLAAAAYNSFATSEGQYAAPSTNGGVFGRDELRISFAENRATTTKVGTANLMADQDFTLRGWLKVTGVASTELLFNVEYLLPASFGAFTGVCLVMGTGSILLKNFGMGTPPTTGAAQSTLLTMPVANGWRYVSMIKQGTTLKIYIDGVLAGTYASLASNAWTVTAALARNTYWAGQGLNFMDFQISNVARDGAFVPGNIFGY